MSDFWNKPKATSTPRPWEQPALENQGMVLDEQAVSEITGDTPQDIFEEEDQDTNELMSDANLRLEQGRLYQMVLANDIFGDTDADPKAIRNVQREIRKFVRERMEIMLGIRHEQVQQAPVVSSPFNDLEVTALKMLASKVTGGKTEEQPVLVQSPNPKKDGITVISGNLRSDGRPAPLPISSNGHGSPRPTQKTQSAPIKAEPQKATPKSVTKSGIKDEGSALTKPIEQMTAEELAAYNKAAEERSLKKRADMPNNLVPHPTTEQLTMMYTMQANDRLQQHAKKMTSI